MYKICDSNLKVITEREHLHQAKLLAEQTSLANDNRVFFVCDPSGSIVAGYGTNPTPAP